MLESNINENIRAHNTFVPPEGFSEWYPIIYRLKSDVLQEVDYCLTTYDYYGAIEIFEENTRENINKKWS